MRLPLCQSSPSFPAGVQVVQFLLRYPVAISPLIMSVHFCLALLALCSLTTAADPDCEELLQPLAHPNRAGGKWILHVGTSDDEEALKEMKEVSGTWIEVLPIAGSEYLTLRWSDKRDGKCFSGSMNVTRSGNSILGTYNFNGTQYIRFGKYIKTSPDCVLWSDTAVTLTDRGLKTLSRNLYLFTKSGILDDEHLEVFKKQAACLNFPPNFHFGDADLCPDEEEAPQMHL